MSIASYIYDNWCGLVFAVLLAFLPPLMIIYAGHEIRFRRLRLILDYENAFTSPQVAENSNPTFEFVKSKYISDIRDSEVAWPQDSSHTTDNKIEALLQDPPGFLHLGSNLRLLATAACFGLLTFFGFAIASAGLSDLLSATPPPSIMDLLVFVGGLGTSDPATATRFSEQILTVISLTFLGGYVSATREFLRRMSLFDLSSYTFLKHAIEILASVLAVFFLYRAFPNPVEQVQNLNQAAWSVPASVPFAWLAIAPLFGLFPESATRYLFLRSRGIFDWLKAEDNRFTSVTRISPLDVIDGVDFWTRIRLEQCGIFDVQNLATYNPIMLYIETPYGIYQVFDWIAQAQLCHILGLEKFLLFREVNVRTIFDLERSVRSTKSPDQYDDVFAAILLAPTDSMRETARIANIKFLTQAGGEAKLVDHEEFCIWARERIAQDSSTTRAIEHMVSWISDDLHVRRLRRLWTEISRSLGNDAMALSDDKDPATPPPDVTPPNSP